MPPGESRAQGAQGSADPSRWTAQERVRDSGAQGQPEGVLPLLPDVELENGQRGGQRGSTRIQQLFPTFAVF